MFQTILHVCVSLPFPSTWKFFYINMASLHSVSSSILIKYKLWPKWFVDETYYGRTGVWTKRLESDEREASRWLTIYLLCYFRKYGWKNRVS
jgi:hypothetical protein